MGASVAPREAGVDRLSRYPGPVDQPDSETEFAAFLLTSVSLRMKMELTLEDKLQVPGMRSGTNRAP